MSFIKARFRADSKAIRNTCIACTIITALFIVFGCSGNSDGYRIDPDKVETLTLSLESEIEYFEAYYQDDAGKLFVAQSVRKILESIRKYDGSLDRRAAISELRSFSDEYMNYLIRVRGMSVSDARRRVDNVGRALTLLELVL